MTSTEMSLSLLGFQRCMLIITAKLSKMAFSYTATCRGNSYKGRIIHMIWDLDGGNVAWGAAISMCALHIFFHCKLLSLVRFKPSLLGNYILIYIYTMLMKLPWSPTWLLQIVVVWSEQNGSRWIFFTFQMNKHASVFQTQALWCRFSVKQ